MSRLPLVQNRLGLESTRVPARDVCGSTDAASGEGKAVNGELEPRGVVGRFANASDAGMKEAVG